MNEETKNIENIAPKLQESLKKMVEEKISRRRLTRLGKSRSFREFILRKFRIVLRDYLASKGIIKWDMLRYHNFCTWSLARILDNGVNYIDDIFDRAEEKFIEKYGLDPKIVGELEMMIIEFVRNINSLYHEYQRVKTAYEEELKKRMARHK